MLVLVCMVMPPGVLWADWYDDCRIYKDANDSTGPWITGKPESQGVNRAKLLSGVKRLARDRDLLSVLVVRNHVLIHESYHHGADSQTAANCHSMSKGLIGVSLCLLVEDGKIPSLDTPVAQLAPHYFAKYSDDDPRRRITVKHLMTMTSGLKWSEDKTEYRIGNKKDWGQAVLDQGMVTKRSCRGRSRVAEPGEIFNYSTGNSHRCSAIIQQFSGETTETFVNAHILTPLGAETEHWGKDPTGVSCGGFNVYMTAREMMRFGQLFLNEGKSHKGTQVLSASTVANVLKDYAPGKNTYGYCCWGETLAGEKCWVFWGWGGQIVCLIPDKQTVFVMTSNTANHIDESAPPWQSFVRNYLVPAMQDVKKKEGQKKRKRRKRCPVLSKDRLS